MFKTQLFAILVVAATFFGISGMSTMANAASDKQIISDMSLQFVRFSTRATNPALDWADKHTTGKAFNDPYRFSAPGKNRSVARVNETYGAMEVPTEDNLVNLLKLSIKKSNISGNDAISIVSKYVKDSRGGHNREFWFSQKIWFKKIKGQWKISDYYILLNSSKFDGRSTMDEPLAVNEGDNLARGVKGNPLGYDSKGIRFPR